MEITPRPFGEVLAEGMTLLVRVWRRLLAPAFWCFTLLGAVTIVTLVSSGANDFLQQLIRDPSSVEAMDDEQLFDELVRLGGAAMVAGLLQLLATGFLNLTAHRIVVFEMAGEAMSTRDAVSWAARRFFVLFLAALLASIAILVGLLLLVIPGIWLAGSFTMLSPVVALEGLGPVASLRRSMELVRGRWWPTVGFLLFVGLLGSAAAQLVQLIALPALATGGVGIGAGLAFVFLMVVQGMVIAAIAVMSTRWYVDLRARKEPLLSLT